MFDYSDLRVLEKICTKENINLNLMQDIFHIEKKYMGYNNRTELSKNLKKILSQEFLHIEGTGNGNED